MTTWAGMPFPPFPLPCPTHTRPRSPHTYPHTTPCSNLALLPATPLVLAFYAAKLVPQAAACPCHSHSFPCCVCCSPSPLYLLLPMPVAYLLFFSPTSQHQQPLFYLHPLYMSFYRAWTGHCHHTAAAFPPLYSSLVGCRHSFGTVARPPAVLPVCYAIHLSHVLLPVSTASHYAAFCLVCILLRTLHRCGAALAGGTTPVPQHRLPVRYTLPATRTRCHSAEFALPVPHSPTCRWYMIAVERRTTIMGQIPV